MDNRAARRENASFEGQNQRVPVKYKEMQEELTQLKAQIAEFESKLNNIPGITTYGPVDLYSYDSAESNNGSRVLLHGKGGNSGDTMSIDHYTNSVLRIFSNFGTASRIFYYLRNDGWYYGSTPIATTGVGKTLLAYPASSIALTAGKEYDICSLNLTIGKWLIWASALASGDYSITGADFASKARSYFTSSPTTQRNVVLIGYAAAGTGGKKITFHIGAKQSNSTAHADPNYCYLRALRIQ